MDEERRTAADWNSQGDILLSSEDFPGAIGAYTQAVHLAPDNSGYLHDLARALLLSRRLQEAEDILSRAVALEPTSWDLFCDLGTAQLEQRKTAQALESFSRALAIKPDAAMVHFNKGNALYSLGNYEEAEKAYRDAVASDLTFAPALTSLAALLGDLGNRKEAASFFEKALALTREEPALLQSYALFRLKFGDLSQGFERYEARFLPSMFGFTPRPFSYPRWSGESLKGNSILLWTEQGVGDEILAASMFTDGLKDAGFAAVECSPRIAPLFVRSFPHLKIIPRDDPPAAATGPWFDWQTAALSLGRFLRPDFSTFPRHGGYLRADPAKVERLRARYKALSPSAKVVGVSWDSTARHGRNKRLPLEMWRPILNIPGVSFVSLQYGAASGDEAADGIFFDEEIEALKDLDSSAAQVAAMDLVITISNTTAHLAGAQNVPVWTLIPNGPGALWYWFRDRETSPWYPSMRLFRQPRPGDWQPVVATAAAALVEFQASGRL